MSRSTSRVLVATGSVALLGTGAAVDRHALTSYVQIAPFRSKAHQLVLHLGRVLVPAPAEAGNGWKHGHTCPALPVQGENFAASIGVFRLSPGKVQAPSSPPYSANLFVSVYNLLILYNLKK